MFNSEYKNDIKNLNYKLLFSIFIGIFLPIFYSYTRIIWVLDQGSENYAMASYWIYIQMAMEILSAFVVLPLFTLKNNKSKSLSILLSVILMSFMITLIMFSFLNLIVNSMISLNTSVGIRELKIYTSLLFIISGLTLLEKYILADIIVEGNKRRVYLLTSISLILKILFDVLFISPISPFEFNLVLLSLSQLIAITIIIIIFISIWIYEYIKSNIYIKFSFNEILNYYKKGLYPGIETLVRNIFYIFITLKIVNGLGINDWNAWNMSGWYYWSILYSITNIFEYFLISERKNNNKINNYKNITYSIYFFDLILFIILAPILISIFMPIIIDDSNYWLDKAILTAYIILPTMIMITFQNILRTKFITEDKYRLIFLNTVISNSIVYLPTLLIMMLGFKINYWENVFIWFFVISISYSLYEIEYFFMSDKQKRANIIIDIK